jgi:hypothetical protein
MRGQKCKNNFFWKNMENNKISKKIKFKKAEKTYFGIIRDYY